MRARQRLNAEEITMRARTYKEKSDTTRDVREIMDEELIESPFSTFPNDIRNFFAAMEANVGRNWPDPGGLGPPVSDQMTPELVTKAKKALQEAQRKAT